MSCFGANDDKKLQQTHEFEKNFKGPIFKRSCTDIICCFIFTVFIFVFLLISMWAFIQGDYRRVVFPTNSEGRLCGVEENENQPYLFLFDWQQCRHIFTAYLGCLTPQICMEKCPSKNWFWVTAYVLEKLSEPNSTIVRNLRKQMVCLDNKDGLDPSFVTESVKDLIDTGKCAGLVLKSKPFLDRCVPDFKDLFMKNYIDKISNSTNFIQGLNYFAKFLSISNVAKNIMKDFIKSWIHIITIISISLLLSYIWLFLLRCFAKILVWFSIVIFVSAFTFGLGYSISKYVTIYKNRVTKGKDEFDSSIQYYLSVKETWLTIAIVNGLILLIIVSLIIFLRPRIRLAIALIQDMSKALVHMVMTLWWPLFPLILFLILIAFCVLVVVHLASIRKNVAFEMPENGTQLNFVEKAQKALADACDSAQNKTIAGAMCRFIKYQAYQYVVYFLLFTVFMFYWLTNFIIALSQMTLAGSFASYYFAFSKPKDIPLCPLWSSFWRCMRYHLGTLAFGSLIIAIVQIVRYIFEYINRKTKSQKHPIAVFVAKCFTCCLWCLEKCLRFLNKNAYIMTAIYGQNFCSAGANAFGLIIRNPLRIAVLGMTSGFVLFIGKLCIVGLIAPCAYFIFDGTISKLNPVLAKYINLPDLNYSFAPVFFIIISAYIVASVCFSVFSMGVDTMLLCFLEDMERNDGSPEKPYYMSRNLNDIVNKSNQVRNIENKSTV